MATQPQAMPVPLPYKPSLPYNLAVQQALFWWTIGDQPPASLPQTTHFVINTKWGIMLRGQERDEPESQWP